MSRERIVIITEPPPQPLTVIQEKHGEDIPFTGAEAPNYCVGIEYEGPATAEQLAAVKAILLQAVADVGDVLS